MENNEENGIPGCEWKSQSHTKHFLSPSALSLIPLETDASTAVSAIPNCKHEARNVARTLDNRKIKYNTIRACT